MKKMTARQRSIFNFIRDTIREKGAPPTIREIGKRFDITSTNGVRTALIALEKKKAIRRLPHTSRGIELVEGVINAASIAPVPILGRIAAGAPIHAEENYEGQIAVDKNLLNTEGLFALRVRGDSMIEAGIFDGDYVFSRQQSYADKGDIIVAIIGEEATVKFYYPENGRIRLEPANRYLGPIIIERDTPGFYIAGKVVGVFRKL